MNQFWKNITIPSDLLLDIKNSWIEIKSEWQDFDYVIHDNIGKSFTFRKLYNKDIENHFNLTVECARIFCIDRHSVCPWHKDTVDITGDIRNFAINIPLENCDKGTNNWGVTKDTRTHTETNKSVIFGQGQYEILETIILDQPKLFRTNIFHNIDNSNNDKDRAVLSYRFKENLNWNQAYNWV